MEKETEKNIATSYVDAGMTGDMSQRKRQRKTVDVAMGWLRLVGSLQL